MTLPSNVQILRSDKNLLYSNASSKVILHIDGTR